MDARSIPVEEPFENKKIAFLEVCGPSEQYYRQLLEAFTDPDSVLKESIHHTLGDSIESLMVLKSSSSPTLETAPVTTPENNSSVILRTKQNGKTYLFTADAGAPALDGVKRSHALAGCWWMQIPHHGSRRNITADLIEHFSPTVAYVSADGSEKHSSLVGRFGE